MEKKFFPDKSPKWDLYHNAVVCNLRNEFNQYPFITNFPIDFAHGQKYQIILSNATIQDAVVDSSRDELRWRLDGGTTLRKDHIAAWRRIDKNERNTQIPKDPKAFLDKLQKDATETTKFIRKSYAEMKLAINIFESVDETLLFHGNSLAMGASLNGAFPPRHYIIKALKIYVRPSYNGSGKKAICSVDLRIKLQIEHDRENETINFEDDPSDYWDCPISSLVVEDAMVDDKPVGLLTNCWHEKAGYNQLIIEDYPEFEKLRSCLLKGQELLGL